MRGIPNTASKNTKFLSRSNTSNNRNTNSANRSNSANRKNRHDAKQVIVHYWHKNLELGSESNICKNNNNRYCSRPRRMAMRINRNKL